MLSSTIGATLHVRLLALLPSTGDTALQAGEAAPDLFRVAPNGVGVRVLSRNELRTPGSFGQSHRGQLRCRSLWRRLIVWRIGFGCGRTGFGVEQRVRGVGGGGVGRCGAGTGRPVLEPLPGHPAWQRRQRARLRFLLPLLFRRPWLGLPSRLGLLECLGLSRLGRLLCLGLPRLGLFCRLLGPWLFRRRLLRLWRLWRLPVRCSRLRG